MTRNEPQMLSPLVAGAATGVCVIAIIVFACAHAGFFSALTRELSDFNAFVIAGQLAWDGAIAEGYHWRFMMAAQKASTGNDSFMPWAYPPPYNLVAAALAAMSQWVAYLLLVGASFGALCIALMRIDPGSAPPALVVLFPSAMVTIVIGQNAFLTGALMASACALALRRSLWAGVILGAMVIKPHLAIGLVLFFIARGRASVLGVALLTASALCAAATFAFGIRIWPAFLAGAGEAQQFLAAGLFQLERMPTAYASARTMGLSVEASYMAHGAVAALALGAIAAAAVWIRDPRMALGLALLGSLFISPYLYEYDLAILAVAITLLLPSIMKHTGAAGFAITGLSGWLATGASLWTRILAGPPSPGPGPDEMQQATTTGLGAVAQGATPSLGLFGLFLFAGLAAFTVWRQSRVAPI